MKIAKALAVISLAAAQDRSEIIFRQIMLFLVFKEIHEIVNSKFSNVVSDSTQFREKFISHFFSSNRMKIPISEIPGSIIPGSTIPDSAIPDSTIPGSITPVSAVWTTLALKLTSKATILAMESVERLTQLHY